MFSLSLLYHQPTLFACFRREALTSNHTQHMLRPFTATSHEEDGSELDCITVESNGTNAVRVVKEFGIGY